MSGEGPYRRPARAQTNDAASSSPNGDPPSTSKTPSKQDTTPHLSSTAVIFALVLLLVGSARLVLWSDGLLPTPKGLDAPPDEYSEERARVSTLFVVVVLSWTSC